MVRKIRAKLVLRLRAEGLSGRAAERAAARMLSEVPNVYRVLYDLSPIPPARVEWE